MLCIFWWFRFVNWWMGTNSVMITFPTPNTRLGNSTHGQIWCYGASAAMTRRTVASCVSECDSFWAMQVPPYWGLSYNPATFQPECRGGFGSPTCAGSVSTCLGFENQSNIPGTNNYTCVPYGGSYWDDCWKCPPKVIYHPLVFKRWS